MISTLNHLLQLHSRSLVVYLSDCMPWSSPENQSKLAVLREVADSQKGTADRIAEHILELNGAPDLGDFPLHFTRFNDLSFEYLLAEAIRRQRQMVQDCADCVAQLSAAPESALAIAEEAHGCAIGDLDKLVDLSHSTSASP